MTDKYEKVKSKYESEQKVNKELRSQLSQMETEKGETDMCHLITTEEFHMNFPEEEEENQVEEIPEKKREEGRKIGEISLKFLVEDVHHHPHHHHADHVHDFSRLTKDQLEQI